MIRAAIVGLGRWGRSLVASVQGKSTQLRCVRAHTRTRASAEEFCRQYDVHLVDSYEQILADPEVDAVVLATPHSLHETQIIAAAAAGKHIHVEKPITLDRAGADRAVEAARKAGVVLAVGYCRRFHPSIVEVRRRLAQGRLGAVVSMVAQHTTSTAQFIVPENWRAAPEEAPGGALTAVGVHALDHMIEFAGRVRDVRCATARTFPGPSDDTTTVMLHFESGATGLIFCSVATATNFSFTLITAARDWRRFPSPTCRRCASCRHRTSRRSERLLRRPTRSASIPASTCSTRNSPNSRAQSTSAGPIRCRSTRSYMVCRCSTRSWKQLARTRSCRYKDKG